MLDQRTDIYSLGATLHELITLKPLVPGNTREEILRHLLHDEAVPLRKVVPSAPVDLETILAKAVEKEPGDRYETAEQLAQDLECFLGNRAIWARRPSLVYRLTKWQRRHHTTITAVVATLLISLSLSTLLLLRAWSQARANWQLARQSVDDMYTELAEEWLRDTPQMTQVQRAFLVKAADFYESVPAAVARDPEVRYAGAEALFRAGRIHGALGNQPNCREYLQRSLDESTGCRRTIASRATYAIWQKSQNAFTGSVAVTIPRTTTRTDSLTCNAASLNFRCSIPKTKFRSKCGCCRSTA
jgi:eukaryotic-like serine/threonine-protein kinase